jgi:hypothetical protein
MFFLRLTLYTCAFYLAIASPFIVGELAVEHWMGVFGIHFHGRVGLVAFAGLWGLVWLAAFLLAFRFAFPELWSKLVA